MNVYFMGGEDVDFINTGSNPIWTSSTTWDAAVARCSLEIVGATIATWPMANSWNQAFSPQSSFWVHAYLALGLVNTTSNNILLAIADSGGVGRLLIRGTGTNGVFKISTRNAAGAFVDLITASAIPSNFSRLDVFVNYSTSGQVQLYANGVVIADTGTGVNVTTDSATALGQIYLGDGYNGNNAYWSEIIVADTDTRASHLWTMNSNTAGNAQTWSGTASNVNKTTISDATFISAASAGLIEEFKTGTIPLPAGTYTVASVKMVARALIGTAGPQHVEYVTRVGSTDYVGGSWGPPIGSFGNDAQNYMQATNPATGIAWTTADLTATTFNYGVESVT